MKVLHVISDSNIGGAGVLLLSLLRNFDSDRVESLVALPKGSALIQRITQAGVPVVELDEGCDRYSAASVREIKAVIRDCGAELIHANGAICARIAGRACGIAVLHTRHCCFPPSGIWRLGAVRFLGGILNRMLSDRVIATAEAAAKDLRILGIPSRKIEVIINGSEPVQKIFFVQVKIGRLLS